MAYALQFRVSEMSLTNGEITHLSQVEWHKVLNVLCYRTERETVLTVREFCTIHSRVCLDLDQRRFSAIRTGWSGLIWPLRTAATAMLCWKTHVVSRRRLTRLKLIKNPNLSMILAILGQAWLNPYWSLSTWQKERSWRLAWRPKVHTWKKLRTSRWGLCRQNGQAAQAINVDPKLPDLISKTDQK